MDPHVLKIINAEIRSRRAVLRVTQLSDGRDRAIREGEPVAGELCAAVRKAFLSGKPALVEADGEQWFLNVYLPSPRLVIIGAVHISQALVPMAKIAGFEVSLIDPRTGFASQERFPGVTLRAEWPQSVLEEDPLDAHTALVALTHDPKIDDPALMAALSSDCFYVGALGSRKTHSRRLERLHQAGFGSERTARIEAPIGLDIGASSPAEIAVAILASIVRALRQRELAPAPASTAGVSA